MDIDALHQEVTQLKAWKARVEPMLEEMLPQYEEHVRNRGPADEPPPPPRRDPATGATLDAASAAARDQARREEARLAQQRRETDDTNAALQTRERAAEDARRLAQSPEPVRSHDVAPTEPGYAWSPEPKTDQTSTDQTS